MEDVYVVMLVALFALAITDLVVGVSNDAVNFLNSAIGSKAVPLRTILIVASLGVAVGAVFQAAYGSGKGRDLCSGEILF
jgi:phosphate/sulfate permease